MPRCGMGQPRAGGAGGSGRCSLVFLATPGCLQGRLPTAELRWPPSPEVAAVPAWPRPGTLGAVQTKPGWACSTSRVAAPPPRRPRVGAAAPPPRVGVDPGAPGSGRSGAGDPNRRPWLAAAAPSPIGLASRPSRSFFQLR
jgi:hypothetical protein